MLSTPRNNSKLLLIFLFCFTLLLILFLSLPWVNAKETPKPKPQDWQINGIVAALDDSYDEVKRYALNKLVEYNLKDLKSFSNKSEEIAQKAAKILKDEKVDANVRYGAASALGNLGDAAAKYVPDIANFLKDEKVDANVRSRAAVALGNLGDAAAKYVPDILNILKDEKVDASVRSGAASALGKLGDAAAKYVPDILNILKDEKVDATVRSGAASALGKLGDAARRILSNPMDLTVVALMLSQGKYPNLFRLQEQQYNLMAAEYLKEWNQEFPLKKFSAAVYEMRLQDKQALPADEFHQVAMSLSDEKYKMAVTRQWQDEKGEAKKEWYFRHDKIMDFFLVQNFLGQSDAAEVLLVDRMGDPRFRGVYFLLATLLPLDAAKELREKLIQYAADTKDNTVSNTFVQLLRTR